MTLYDLVRQRAASMNVPLEQKAIERIVGTLRMSGATTDTAAAIIDTELRRQPTHQVRTASTKGNTQEFLANKGVCPNCKTQMSMVKLSEYENALYCQSCRATLW